MQRTEDLNVLGTVPLITPRELKQELPITDAASETVAAGRQALRAVLEGRDARLIVIAGPCSIHDPAAALEYGRRLKTLADEVADQLVLVMRTYFEKPRTTVGWKGLINDPFLDGSYDMPEGLRRARALLIALGELGVPAGTEILEPIVPQYIADLIAWSAIGARTTESQTHREIASGLSMPVGFKNSTDGNLQLAVNAILSAREPHHFLGIDHAGRTCVIRTRGNDAAH
ncbi:MAG TPA: 3-deoxy-7-phosphoheptulonate synthase, partial [Candidatus Hydrogenedentes bacterium]|nr:3-deoxy-7-phosphoheptulonate synthase [Candidatus Hydrogenedentota bacterium]